MVLRLLHSIIAGIIVILSITALSLYSINSYSSEPPALSYVYVGVEPSESNAQTEYNGKTVSWGSTDLDITNISIGINSTHVVFRIGLAKVFNYGSGKGNSRVWWQIFLDLDKDSNKTQQINTINDFGWDYALHIVNLVDNSDTLSCQVIKHGDNYVSGHCKFIAEEGSKYIYIITNRTLPENGYIGDSFYLMGRTAIRNQSMDTALPLDLAPRDDYSGTTYDVSQTGDYYIYNIDTQPPAWTIEYSDTDQGSVSPDYLNILWLNETYQQGRIYTGLGVEGTYLWYQPAWNPTEYRVYFDTDNNQNTGYQLKDSNTNQVILGAEYRVLYTPGYIPVLQKYNEKNEWTFVEKIDYLQNPGDKNSLILKVPLTQLNTNSNQITIAGETAQGETYPQSRQINQVDITGNEIVPVPESTWISIGILSILLFTVIYLKHITQKN